MKIKGLELSRQYYENYGQTMIYDKFYPWRLKLAVGLVGEGSECFGFDDESSRDHDWGPGFCIWLTDTDFNKIGKSLQKAYDEMPGSFLDIPPRIKSTEGSRRIGVLRISDFYKNYIGMERVPETLQEWNCIPESFLATATNGEVFSDPLGAFSRVRNILKGFYPEDIRLNKICARVAIMAQSGQYNFMRCVKRKEVVAAGLALGEFTQTCLSAVYLLNKQYMPFYKWAHHGVRFLPKLSEFHGLLGGLYSGCTVKEQEDLIEKICALLICEMKSQGISYGTSDFLLDHCAEIKSRIKDDTIRNTHIMAG